MAVKRRHNAYRSRVAKEILETEKKYVESLELCISKFLTPLQSVSVSPRMSKPRNMEADLLSNPPPILQPYTIRKIFSDIKMIYSFHLAAVLKPIEPRVEQWNIYQCLGDIFLQIVSFFLSNQLNYEHNYVKKKR